ncbi:hypothetical protein LCGC14_2742920, partial [marine sediment metagenome]
MQKAREDKYGQLKWQMNLKLKFHSKRE